MKNSTYRVEFAPRVEKQLSQIPKKIRGLIYDKIEQLTSNPRPENIEPLHGGEIGLFRIRQGDYRIVYTIEDHCLLILIVSVVHRKEVYKKKHIR